MIKRGHPELSISQQCKLVRRYHIRAGQEQLPLLGGHHGLGHVQSPELAGVKHDACRLLRRSAERGHRQIRPT